MPEPLTSPSLAPADADGARDLGRRLRPAIVAIDGPAGSGKSTIGFAVAGQLDYLYFDTGIMYRAVTYAVLVAGGAIADEAVVTEAAHRAHIDLAAPTHDHTDGRYCSVLLDGVDITWAIRTPEIDRNVSPVAAYPGVRAALTHQQQRIARRYGAGTADKPGIVMVGRDIGTVVVPEAAAKIFMDATAEERAQRRHAELLARGRDVPYAEVLSDIHRRDEIDSQRAVAPLHPAADAVILDTTALTPQQVVERVIDVVRQRVHA